ncbi:DivIVA domain-containing protein [Planobispora takensis]|uniref:DivIVA domain-containing protein n=1 Tax=Planobispora takensis TaxID=1367882 RepID=UPI001942392E|nr:DivIVA domain-containing protein [Planobispora takensis]
MRSGYDPDQVDALIRRIEGTLGRGTLVGEPITADEIRDARFRTKLGGYNETAVDFALEAFIVAVETRFAELHAAQARTVATRTSPPGSGNGVARSVASGTPSPGWPDPDLAAPERPGPGPVAPERPGPVAARPPAAVGAEPARGDGPADEGRAAVAHGGEEHAAGAEGPAEEEPYREPFQESHQEPLQEQPHQQSHQEPHREQPHREQPYQEQSYEERPLDPWPKPPMPVGITLAERERQALRVEQVAFRPGRLGMGYNEGEVDVFLDRLVATLRGTTEQPLTPGDVREARFATVMFKPGYSVGQVDAFLAEMAGVLEEHLGR